MHIYTYLNSIFKEKRSCSFFIKWILIQSHLLLLLSLQTAATQIVNTSATTTTAPAVNEELAAKEANTKTEATLVKSLQAMPTIVKVPVGSRTKRTTETVTATSTTIVKEEGLSSVDVKPSEATDHGMEKELVDDDKEDKIPSDKATCIEG